MSGFFDHLPDALKPIDIDMSLIPEDQHGEIVELETRFVRDVLLKDSDFRVVADSPWDTAPWIAYRQALRDLPDDPSWPIVDFPTPPE